jgi:hypothetical protein
MANMILTECSACGTVVAAEAIAQYSAVLNPQLGATERITFARCRKCDSPFLVGEEFFGGSGGGTDGTEAWSDPYRVYPSRDELLRPKLPPTVQNPYREAINCIKAQAYSAATMMCYRTLDAACIEHNISEATLAESLAEMQTQGIVRVGRGPAGRDEHHRPPGRLGGVAERRFGRPRVHRRFPRVSLFVPQPLPRVPEAAHEGDRAAPTASR